MMRDYELKAAERGSCYSAVRWMHRQRYRMNYKMLSIGDGESDQCGWKLCVICSIWPKRLDALRCLDFHALWPPSCYIPVHRISPAASGACPPAFTLSR